MLQTKPIEQVDAAIVADVRALVAQFDKHKRPTDRPYVAGVEDVMNMVRAILVKHGACV